jgi:hypothetical protein
MSKQSRLLKSTLIVPNTMKFAQIVPIVDRLVLFQLCVETRSVE